VTRSEGVGPRPGPERDDGPARLVRQRDFYAVLGVSKDVSDGGAEEKTFRSFARQFTPTSNPVSASERAFKESA